jgi:mycofactocin glycosyltransferase
MEILLPDQLKELWQSVDRKEISVEQFYQAQERFLAEYRSIWEQALILEGNNNLEESLLSELASFCGGESVSAILDQCSSALSDVKAEWLGTVDRHDRQSVEKFYDKSQSMIYELTWWHTLSEDLSPLAYVAALRFAKVHGCRNCLDFGAGVGSGAILLARHGLAVTLADISSSMLSFSQWRFHQRGLPALFIDLKDSSLPANAYDMLTAMDVFEHLVDPVRAIDALWRSLKPGGFLFGRFHSDVDEDRPHHIVQDFGATLQRLQALGFVQVWHDQWLWGHQVFQKP